MRKKIRFKEWKLIEQGLKELGDKRTDSLLIERGTTLNTLAVNPLLRSPLGGSFFSNSSLLILPNPFSSDTPIPFL